MSENVKNEESRYRRWILPILGAIIGILLLIFGNRTEKSDEKEKDASTLLIGEGELSAESFADVTEKRIVAICSGVTGVEDVRAVVTLEGGYRAVYASDVQGSDSSYRKETVLTGSGSLEKAILVGYDAPRIVGIGIVCTGGDDPAIKQRITLLVSAAFDVSANKIYVTGGK